MKYSWLTKGFLVIIILWGVIHSNAQDPKRFQKEIETLAEKDYCFSPDKELLLFTGSSSIRMWKDVQSAFPEHHVINNGFGGSHFSDLIYYYDELIGRHDPDYLFIYEGDNDIASGKDPKKVRDEARLIVDRIRQDKPQAKIVLIAAKPSVARWELKKEYEKLNRHLERIAKKTKGVEFADVWKAMLDEKGEVYHDVFVDDNLHMNDKGYRIWEQVIGRHLEQ
jgi:lysophospholipase L1-like esterase